MRLFPALAVSTFLVFSAVNTQAQTTKTLTRDDVSQAFKFFEKKSQGTIGAAAMDLQTGERIDINGDKPFPMQSVYKLPIAMAVLNQIDAGKLKLDQQVELKPSDYAPKDIYSPVRDNNPEGGTFTLIELIKPTVSISDNSTSDYLMKFIGGPTAVSAYLNDIGSTQILVKNYEREIQADWSIQYKNSSTPYAMVDLLAKLHRGDGLSSSSRDRLIQIMRDTTTGPNRIKGNLPKNVTVAHKTGTSGKSNGITAATNDAGIITLPDGRHIAIAVFVMDSKANEATRDEAIANIATTVVNHFSRIPNKSN